MDNLNENLTQKNESTDNVSLSSTPDLTSKDYSGNSAKTSRTKTRSFPKFPKYLVVVVGLIIVVSLAFLLFRNTGKVNSTSTLGATDKRIDIEKPKSSQTLNRLFNFPLKGSDGKEVSKLKYEIQNAELRDQIIIKGQKATAVEGRTFLVLNLKIGNDYNKAVQINARDYIRLVVNNSTEKLAPDIHNDPVEIQAISTKYTRLGFPINDTDTNLVLQIGEISGPKETVKLELK